MLVAALFRLDRIPCDAGDGTLNRVAIEVGDGDAREGEDGHVTIGEKDHVAGVVEDAGDVRGDEGLALADADDDGRAGAGGDDFVWLECGENAEGEGAGESLDSATKGFFKQDGLTRGFRVLLDLLDEVGDNFGVGFRDEDVALVDEFAFQVEVVFNDSIVDYDDAACAVAMGVGVFFGGAAVGGPAGVADAVGAVEGMVAEDVLEIDELAGSAADFKGFVSGAADGDTGRIVAAILETPQTFNDDGNYCFWTYIADDSAHRTILCDGAGLFGERRCRRLVKWQ